MNCEFLQTTDHCFHAAWVPGQGAREALENDTDTSVNAGDAGAGNENGTEKSGCSTSASSSSQTAVFAAGLITGQIEFFNKNGFCTLRKKRHNESVRCFEYFKDDNRLVSVSTDGTALLTDAEGKRIHRYGRFGRQDFEALNKVVIYDENTFIMGDDAGALHFCDTRVGGNKAVAELNQKNATDTSSRHKKKKLQKLQQKNLENQSSNTQKTWRTTQEQDDYISDLLVKDEMVCATSGDGTLGVWDMSKRKLHALSDPQDDELLSMCLVRDGKKLVCGSQTGDLRIFTWGDFGDMKDRIIGHPNSIDSMTKIDEDLIVTGCGDGTVRLTSIHAPDYGGNVILGAVGRHAEGRGVITEEGSDSDSDGSFSSDSEEDDFNLKSINAKAAKQQKKNSSKSPTKKGKKKSSRHALMESDSDATDDDSDAGADSEESGDNSDDNSDSEDERASDLSDDERGSGATPSGRSKKESLFMGQFSGAGQPVEALISSLNNPYAFASVSHDNVIKFWNCQTVVERIMKGAKSEKKKTKRKIGKKSKMGGGGGGGGKRPKLCGGNAGKKKPNAMPLGFFDAGIDGENGGNNSDDGGDSSDNGGGSTGSGDFGSDDSDDSDSD